MNLSYMYENDPSGKGTQAGTVFGLISGVDMATRIAKAARVCGLGVYNTDKTESLIKTMGGGKPVLILIDWDGCEREAYKLMDTLRGKTSLKRVPILGFVSKAKEMIKDEAQRAGCDRVYFKTEFIHDLDIILARCAL